MNLKSAQTLVRNASGNRLILVKRDSEYCVKVRGRRNDTGSYFTNDIQDAVDTAYAMVRNLDPKNRGNDHWHQRGQLNKELIKHGLDEVPPDANVLADIAAEAMRNAASADELKGIRTLYMNLEAGIQSGELTVKGL